MPGNPYYRSPHWKQLRERCLARDHYRCTVSGCTADGTIADHVVSRPPVPYSTPQDVLSNLRTLCKSHDAQVKERRRGDSFRKQSGQFRVKGCDVNGWPIDPRRRQ